MKRWKLLDIEETHAWVIVEEGSEAERNPSKPSAAGGIIGCSEWMWLEKNIAEEIVNLHNKQFLRE